MTLIKLNYGPYEAHGIIRYRPQRLHGLIQALTNKNYCVELIQSEHINRLTVDIYGVTVFRCDIRNLLFNIDSENDVVCKRALDAIDEASKRIFDETNVPKFISVDEGMRHIEKKKMYETVDYLKASNVKLIFEIQTDFKNVPTVQVEEKVIEVEEMESKHSRESTIRFKKTTEDVINDSDISLNEDSADSSTALSNLLTVSDLNPPLKQPPQKNFLEGDITINPED